MYYIQLMIICSLDWQELTPLLDLAQARSMLGPIFPKWSDVGFVSRGMPMDAHGCPILWPFELISYGKNQDSLGPGAKFVWDIRDILTYFWCTNDISHLRSARRKSQLWHTGSGSKSWRPSRPAGFSLVAIHGPEPATNYSYSTQ